MVEPQHPSPPPSPAPPGTPATSKSVEDSLPRTVRILKPNANVASNSIITSLYTWYTFPTIGVLELLYPWKKFANFYFLCVGMMQMVPSVSLTSGQPSSYMTLTFIILVEMFFKGREDLERARGDRVTNRTPVEVLQVHEPGDDKPPVNQFVQKPWSAVQVGDVVRVKSRETFPADLLLLRASDPPGQCWVNTKPLDGETDSKLRVAPKPFLKLLEPVESFQPANLRRILAGHLKCEDPNDKVNDITAQLCLDDGSPPAILSEDNFLLRGCQLRNTDWVLALVVTTGVQTKISYTPGAEDVGKPMKLSEKLKKGMIDMVSGAGVKIKTGRVAHTVNVQIMGVVIWLVVMCLSGGILYVMWEYSDVPWYLDDDDNHDTTGFIALVQMTARFFLICYQFVPISLYVSMMMFQTLSRQFVIAEMEMYDANLDEPCQVRQMSLLDELGQVSHIFSDKTGTLTSNHMEFRRCFIFSPEGLSYGCGETAISKSLREASQAMQNGEGKSPSPVYEGLTPTGRPDLREPKDLPAFVGCKEASRTYCNYEEELNLPSLFDALQMKNDGGAACREFMLALAVNHSVLLEMVNGKLELSASSPDEQAFVAAAEYFGFDFVQRDADRGVLMIVDKQTKEKHEVELLHAFPYESSRKRMSVIVKLPPKLLEVVGGGAPVRLYTKGADSVLLDTTTDVLEPNSRGSDDASMEKLDVLLGEWADIALRTLVFAKKEMPNFDEWNRAYEAAICDPENIRKAKLGEDNPITSLQSQAESGLTLQGATAIEDKLQGGVPEILADLREAGIKVWMLTGDKVGTAKNIATACNILPSDADTLEVTTETFPVLADLKTSELLGVARALDHASQLPLGQSLLTPAVKKKSLLSRMWPFGGGGGGGGSTKGRRDSIGSGGNRAAYLEALELHTARLDEAYPELTQVRAALRDRQLLMAERMVDQEMENGKGGPRGKRKSRLSSKPPSSEPPVTPQQLAKTPGGSGGGSSSGRNSGRNSGAEKRPSSNESGSGGGGELCLVLDEMAIEYCGLLCKEVLAAVGHGSRSVVACRARKDQKAQLLNLIKDNVPTSCCLAIGDGANDVAMIKAGHIGVGIIGKEGMQAVNNSDFAIGQFRFLRHLLFVHGRFAYKRTATFCYYMFYKNITNVLAMYFYTMCALASGDRLFPQAYIEVYNIIFTSLPIILFGVFDQDVEKSVAAHSPMLYTPGIYRIYYTHRGFVLWMIEATYLAVLAVYLPAAALGYPGGPGSNGGKNQETGEFVNGGGWSLSSPPDGDPDISSISMAGMLLVCVGVNMRLAIETHSWTTLEHIVFWGTVTSIELACMLFSFVYYPVNSLPTSYNWNAMLGIVQHVQTDFCYWAVGVLTLVLALFPRTLGKAWSVLFKASASRRAKRLALQQVEKGRRSSVKMVSVAKMAVPGTNDMARYRASLGGSGMVDEGTWNSRRGSAPPSPLDRYPSQLSGSSMASTVGRVSEVAVEIDGTPNTARRSSLGARSSVAATPESSVGGMTPGGRRKSSRSAFSNDDRTSARIMSQIVGNGRASIGALLDAVDEKVVNPIGKATENVIGAVSRASSRASCNVGRLSSPTLAEVKSVPEEQSDRDSRHKPFNAL